MGGKEGIIQGCRICALEESKLKGGFLCKRYDLHLVYGRHS